MRTRKWKMGFSGIVMLAIVIGAAAPSAGSVFAEVIPGPYEPWTLPWYYNLWLEPGPYPTIGTNGDGETLTITGPDSVVVSFPEGYEAVDGPGYDINVYCSGWVTIRVSSAADPLNQAYWGYYYLPEPGVLELDFANHPGITSVKYVTIGVYYVNYQVNLDAVESLYPGTPEPTPVDIDIKPGSYPNSLNINGNGVIPVAILGSASFDVSQIDPATLLFNGSELRVRGKNPGWHIEDVSGDFSGGPEGAPDGIADLMCQFVDDPTQWVEGQTEAIVTGNLLDGTPIEGTDSVNIVQQWPVDGCSQVQIYLLKGCGCCSQPFSFL